MIKRKEIPEKLMRELRSSVILAGSLIGRFGEVCFSHPGGCDIGSRPIDLHINSFKKLGVNVEENSSKIKCRCDKIKATKIHLDFPSVGATENIILASVMVDGEVIIENAAMEPEIVDLQNFLNKMGAKIEGAGTNIIKINGVKELKPVSYNIMPDRIEAGTMLVATAITSGEVLVKNIVPEHISAIINKLEEIGCNLDINSKAILIKAPRKLKNTEIKTLPYPGFPTDMQPIFSSLLCTTKGISIVSENIFESRYKYINELKRMGAKVTIEGKTLIIMGRKRLNSAVVDATDLRGGAAMVLAGLNANGKTVVRNIEYILRGYENFDKKLQELGANISKKEGEFFEKEKRTRYKY